MRSPLLMNPNDTALIVIDVQEKLVPAISGQQRMVWNIQRLIKAAEVLEVPVRVTEQYPKGLGHTIQPLKELLGDADEKAMFSCRECQSMWDELRGQGVTKLALVGIESHVCVQQTALDCIAAGFNVYLIADAIGSRATLDRDIALKRMETSGCFVTTTEAAMFEWCESSQSPGFKAISQLVQEEFNDA